MRLNKLMSMGIVLCILVWMIALNMARADTFCQAAAFAFAEAATATVNCGLPRHTPTLKALFETANRLCGPPMESDWPGAQEGATAFFDDVRAKGKVAVCAQARTDLK